MPILHIQIQAQHKKPDGTLVNVRPSEALIARGPVVQVSVTVEQTVAQNLIQNGIPVPDPVTGLGLIDTGATSTCIDEKAARKLSLPVIDVVSMSSATDKASMRNVYPIQIEVIGLPIRLQAPRALGAELEAQGLLLLIGRDALQFCTIFYNGPMGQITLTI